MLSALRQADKIALGHLMVEEKSNEIPVPELIEALSLQGCLFTLDAEHCQKASVLRYLALTLAYFFLLNRFALLDVATIGALFTPRVVTGTALR